MTAATDQAGRAADDAHRKAAPWLEKLARAGYAGKGLLYFVVGFLAVKAAVGMGGDVGGSKNALLALAGEGTLGTILLWVIGIGLVGYAVWNTLRAFLDPENDDSVPKRLFFGLSAGIHGVLAYWVFSSVIGGGSSGGSSSGGGSGSGSGGTQGMVATALGWGVAGQILVGLAGLGILGFGLYQLYKAYKVDLSDKLMMGRMSESVRKFTRFVGRFGLAARGVIFVMVGAFIAFAAFQSDSSEAGGLGSALKTLGGVGGGIALGLVAAGLAAYGLYMIVESKYRRIETR